MIKVTNDNLMPLNEGSWLTSLEVVSKLHTRTSKQCHMDDAILGIGKV